MNRFMFGVLGLCFAIVATQQSFGQVQCNLSCNSGAGGTPATLPNATYQQAPVYQASAPKTSPAVQNYDTGAISCCGQPQAYFNQCGGQCGGSCAGTCGTDSCCGSRFEQMIDRFAAVSARIPSLDKFLTRKCCNLSRYRSVFAGGVELEDYEGNVGSNDITGTFRDGFILGTASGHWLDANHRFEMEAAWRNNSGDIWTNSAVPGSVPFDGHFNVFSTMANLIRDFNCDQLPIGLYVGGGIGAANQDGEFDVNGNEFTLEDWAFAYQGFIGLNLLDCKKGSLFVEYRYFGMTETDLESNGNFFDDFSYESQNVILGARINY